MGRRSSPGDRSGGVPAAVALRRAEGRRRRGLVLSLAPALGLLLALYGGGLALAAAQSLGYFPVAGLTDVSLDAYAALLARPEIGASLALTLWVALASTVLASALGLAGALLLRSASRFGRRSGRLSTFVFQLNLPIPHAVGAVAVLLLLAQSGLVARLLHALGVIDSAAAFPALVADRAGVGIIVEYVWKTATFTGVVLFAALAGKGEHLEEAARTLGAGAWARFRFVTLPVLRQPLVGTSILVFAFTFGSYEVPYVLGQRGTALLPVVAYREYARVDLAARPEAMALGLVIAAIVTVLVLAYARWAER